MCQACKTIRICSFAPLSFSFSRDRVMMRFDKEADYGKGKKACSV